MNVEEGYDASSLNERMVRYVRLLSIVLTMNFSGRNVVASTVISMARICPPFLRGFRSTICLPSAFFLENAEK